MTTDTAQTGVVERVSADLCVVGGGIAAINAMVVACGYLNKDSRVVLIERKPRSGGMWTEVYDFVRLHQPHEYFTAGAIPWQGGMPKSYLATREEVLEHFDHMLDYVRARVSLDEHYGWEFAGHNEEGGRVVARANGPNGARMEIDTARLIKGFGLEPGADRPLEVSSGRIRSIAPSQISQHREELLGGEAPIWIAGGGKTAMDTAHLLLTKAEERELNMVVGGGTLFSNRDRVFPDRALDRWRPRATPNMLNAECVRHFDGNNETEVFAWMLQRFGLSLVDQPDNFLFGLLSEAENQTIARGVSRVLVDRFVNAHDRGDGSVEFELKSGVNEVVPAGTWLLNCTGFIRATNREYEPFVSASGNVLCISQRSAVLLLPAFSGYFLTHMMYQDKLAETPLYELDYAQLLRVGKRASILVLSAVTQYNLYLMSDALPLKTFMDCGLDYDRWMPIPHRLVAQGDFLTRRRKARPRLRKVLDASQRRFQVRCGPLDHHASDATGLRSRQGHENETT